MNKYTQLMAHMMGMDIGISLIRHSNDYTLDCHESNYNIEARFKDAEELVEAITPCIENEYFKYLNEMAHANGYDEVGMDSPHPAAEWVAFLDEHPELKTRAGQTYEIVDMLASHLQDINFEEIAFDAREIDARENGERAMVNWIKTNEETDFINYGGVLLRGHEDNRNAFDFILLHMDDDLGELNGGDMHLFRGSVDVTNYIDNEAVADYVQEHYGSNVDMLGHPAAAAEAIVERVDMSELAPVNIDGVQAKPDHYEDFLITYEQLVNLMREEGMMGWITDEILYEAYKENWIKEHIDYSLMQETLRQYIENAEDDVPLSEYVEEYGFADGSLYASFDEWMEYEKEEQQEITREMAQTAYDEAAAVYRMANGLDDYDSEPIELDEELTEQEFSPVIFGIDPEVMVETDDTGHTYLNVLLEMSDDTYAELVSRTDMLEKNGYKSLDEMHQDTDDFINCYLNVYENGFVGMVMTFNWEEYEVPISDNERDAFRKMADLACQDRNHKSFEEIFAEERAAKYTELMEDVLNDMDFSLVRLNDGYALDDQESNCTTEDRFMDVQGLIGAISTRLEEKYFTDLEEIAEEHGVNMTGENAPYAAAEWVEFLDKHPDIKADVPHEYEILDMIAHHLGEIRLEDIAVEPEEPSKEAWYKDKNALEEFLDKNVDEFIADNGFASGDARTAEKEHKPVKKTPSREERD